MINKFNKKTATQQNAHLWYLLFLSLGSLTFLTVKSGFKIQWNTGFLCYSLVFGVCYALTVIFNVVAIKCGPLSLTALIVSYSLILSTCFGIIVLREPASPFLLIGVVLLIISLALIHIKANSQEKRYSVKWIICSVLAAVGNSFLICTQKIFQTRYKGVFQTEFMFFSMLAVIVISITFILITRSKPGRSTIKQGGLFATVSGVMNALTNLLVMTVSINMPLSVVSPFVSAGGILITALFAFLFFREKLSMRELVGLVVGTVSVVFLCL